jgi:PAS domain S-box-containing protein
VSLYPSIFRLRPLVEARHPTGQNALKKMTSIPHIITNKPASWHAEFIDNLPVGVFRTTVEGKLIFCNRRLAEIFGFDSTNDFVGYPVADLYINKKNRGDMISVLLEKGYVEDVCFPFKRKDGTQIWCSITARAVFDNDGIVVFLDGSTTDVTDKIEEMDAEVSFDNQKQLTKEKLQGVLEMAGGAAHRLNQPLMIINNLLDEVLSDVQPGDVNFQKALRIRVQIKKLNAVAKKIAGIRKYRAMDYVGGIKIVDIDNAS